MAVGNRAACAAAYVSPFVHVVSHGRVMVNAGRLFDIDYGVIRVHAYSKQLTARDPSPLSTPI